ncbi:CBS domain-containing protein [Streptomyces xanthii]|uniref:CBS domain-containing protein n=2 Tax=Streptomyces xanthii TaxID=2768069 RepID=A0A7H1BK68_9ACTN|nr:CBS domain-containing protein [Streptomyces xanthii]QNS09123.1 CBS domain-containing protein [Streptomyces xanthii]
MYPRPARNTAPAAVDPLDHAGPQVWDAMTVEVALSLMAAARTRHLVICDEDGLRTGRVTLAGLTAVRESPRYSDRTRLRDIVAGSASFPPALHTGSGLGDRNRTAPPEPATQGRTAGLLAGTG